MYRQVVKWSAGVLLAAVLGFVSWLGLTALQAKASLEQARASAAQAKDALLRSDDGEALQFAEEAKSHARKAHDATTSVPWTIGAAVPFLGSPFKTGQQIADVVAGLATDVLQPAAHIGTVVSAAKLFGDQGVVDLQLLRSEEPRLSEIAQAAARLDAEARAIARPAYLDVIRAARTQLQDQTTELSELLSNTALAAGLAPSMLGAVGPRTYLLVFQTNAEARGTGGLLGGFGILRFDNGKPSVELLASNAELSTAVADIDLGPEFNEHYGWTNAYTDFRNSNLSSHFPYAARIWRSMWERQSETKVDGVIAVDPVALSYVLEAAGPITLPDGEEVTDENVVELTESTAYARFPDDQMARKEYLQTIATEAVRKVIAGVRSPRALLNALGRSVGERRIAIWSASPDDQRLLEQTTLAHSVPDDTAPHAEVVINNLAGNKMDYYLRREIGYTAGDCASQRRESAVTVRLTNTAQQDMPLPEYVSGRSGLVEGLPLNAPGGTMVTSVRLLATSGARLERIESNGGELSANIAVERGHPSYEVQVVIPPGQSGELIFRLSEPTTAGAARVPVQPLIDSVTPVVSVPACEK